MLETAANTLHWSVFPAALDYTQLSVGLDTDRASQGFVAAHCLLPQCRELVLSLALAAECSVVKGLQKNDLWQHHMQLYRYVRFHVRWWIPRFNVCEAFAVHFLDEILDLLVWESPTGEGPTAPSIGTKTDSCKHHLGTPGHAWFHAERRSDGKYENHKNLRLWPLILQGYRSKGFCSKHLAYYALLYYYSSLLRTILLKSPTLNHKTNT